MSRTNGKTIPFSNYPTPGNAVRALLQSVDFRPTDRFLEPCRGEGAIYDPVPLPEPRKYWAEIRQGRDYLSTWFPEIDVIITNPPFPDAVSFLEKARGELAADGTMIFLLRLDFLGSLKRAPFWKTFGFPHKLFILTPRPRFVGRQDSGEYAWFCWDFGNRTPGMRTLDHSIAIPRNQRA
uniref:DNA methyltransferase n=1 Tax=Candidatus Kentrum sp. LPFa TaxID=2126335 RepID=A0A450WD78_9GAMM|nr:MAG: hypothetical protein BECKLPF1236B_GA0070989_107123 [Candidatus Kentron sp. LPFa]